MFNALSSLRSPFTVASASHAESTTRIRGGKACYYRLIGAIIVRQLAHEWQPPIRIH